MRATVAITAAVARAPGGLARRRIGVVAFVVLVAAVIPAGEHAAYGAGGPLLYTLTTPNSQAGAYFGSSVATGDVNGDGSTDMIIGAPSETAGGNTEQGRLYVYSGTDGSLLYTLTTPNPQANAWFGGSAAAGDRNGDGKADIMVGAIGETVGGDAQQGRAYVFSGADGSLIYTLTTPNPEANASFGVVTAGDVNGDGKADVIVGASRETVSGNPGQGRVYVFSGADGSLLRTFTTPNPQAYAWFGPAAAGDVNADGNADIVVGASQETVAGNTYQGRAYVFSGTDGSLLYTLTTPNPQAFAGFGGQVKTGDVNGDGKADVIVGALFEAVAGNYHQGRAYVYSGADGSLLYALTTPNPQANAWFGESAAAGDIDGDGKADLTVNAPYETVGGNPGQGRVYVFSGADGSLRRTLTTPNPQANARFGSVAAADANGRPIIVVGAYWETVAGNTFQGRAYVFSGVSSVGGVAIRSNPATLMDRSPTSTTSHRLVLASALALIITFLAFTGGVRLRRRHRST